MHETPSLHRRSARQESDETPAPVAAQRLSHAFYRVPQHGHCLITSALQMEGMGQCKLRTDTRVPLRHGGPLAAPKRFDGFLDPALLEKPCAQQFQRLIQK